MDTIRISGISCKFHSTLSHKHDDLRQIVQQSLAHSKTAKNCKFFVLCVHRTALVISWCVVAAVNIQLSCGD